MNDKVVIVLLHILLFAFFKSRDPREENTCRINKDQTPVQKVASQQFTPFTKERFIPVRAISTFIFIICCRFKSQTNCYDLSKIGNTPGFSCIFPAYRCTKE